MAAVVIRPLMCRLLRGALRTESRALSTYAPSPAICAVQLAPKPEKRAELEGWLCEGRLLLEKTLHAHRDKANVPAAAIVGSDVRSCFHWVHVPSSDEVHPDTVAIVFTSDNDLSLWRQSPERVEWLASGVARGLARDNTSVLVEAEKITLHKDDGSLGSWLPNQGQQGQRDLVPPPPTWKVAATVLIAMYPVQEANRLLLLPLLASSPAWASMPPTLQVFGACAWTCGAVTILLLPHARTASEGIGFIGGQKGCPGPQALASATVRLLLLYSGLIGLGMAANSVASRVKQTSLPADPPSSTSNGVWSALPVHGEASQAGRRY